MFECSHYRDGNEYPLGYKLRHSFIQYNVDHLALTINAALSGLKPRLKKDNVVFPRKVWSYNLNNVLQWFSLYEYNQSFMVWQLLLMRSARTNAGSIEANNVIPVHVARQDISILKTRQTTITSLESRDKFCLLFCNNQDSSLFYERQTN